MSFMFILFTSSIRVHEIKKKIKNFVYAENAHEEHRMNWTLTREESASLKEIGEYSQIKLGMLTVHVRTLDVMG